MIWKTRSYATLSIFASVILVALITGDLYAQGLRVGIIGDQTGATDLNKAYQILADGVEKLKHENVDLILHVGDLIESNRPEVVVRNDFRRAVDIISTLQKPWYISAGDHDVNPGDWIPNSTDRRKECLFKELLSSTVPAAKTRLYYSFDQGGYHFVTLYSQEHLHTDPRWGNTFLSKISDEQHAWLKDDLVRNRATAGTVVLVHQPLWYNWAGWLPIHRTLRAHNVLVVVAGHHHYDQDDGVIDGIRYVVIGATGGAVKDANANSGGMHQVAVLDLLNSKANFKLLNVKSGEEVKFTSRMDADRVQAIDYTMGGLSGFDGYNRFYLKGNTLVDDCISAKPAQMSLFNIGNPIDLPVKIVIQYDATKFELTAPHFSAGFCEDGDAGMQCKIRPGDRMAVSNPSGASPCFASCPSPMDMVPNSTEVPPSDPQMAVWSAQIRPAIGHLKENDQMQIQVSMQFEGEHGSMLVWKSLKSHPVTRCTK